MIDEKRLIEKFTSESDKDWYTPWIIDVINKQPKVGECDRNCADCWKTKLVTTPPKLHTDAKHGEWIPCSERLPNTNGVYNVTRKLAEGECKFYISDSAYFDGQDTWHADNRVNHGREYLKDVVAWSELPEPYKGVD